MKLEEYSKEPICFSMMYSHLYFQFNLIHLNRSIFWLGPALAYAVIYYGNCYLSLMVLVFPFILSTWMSPLCSFLCQSLFLLTSHKILCLKPKYRFFTNICCLHKPQGTCIWVSLHCKTFWVSLWLFQPYNNQNQLFLVWFLD